MFRALIHWVLSAIALMVVANLVPGFYRERPAVSPARGAGNRRVERNARLLSQGHHVSVRHCDIRSVPAGYQRSDDHAGRENRSRLHCVWMGSGLLGRGGPGDARHADPCAHEGSIDPKQSLRHAEPAAIDFALHCQRTRSA